MKRWTLRITVCLILGAVTTVGVAWSIAWWGQPAWPPSFRGSESNSAVSPSRWDMHREAHWPSQPDRDPYARRSFGTDWTMLTAVQSQTVYQIGFGRAGLPMTAMEFLYKDSEMRPQYFWTWPSVSVSLNSADGMSSKFVPLNPVFPGFLINTLFYAAIWFGLFFATGMTRRFIRTRRGRCPRCGYDLQKNLEDGCSECGWNRASSQSANSQEPTAKGVSP